MSANSRDDATRGELGFAVRKLLRAGQQMQGAMAHRLGLGSNDLAAMDELVSSPQLLGPAELGNRLGIRSASATVLVDRLQQAGHLRREPHPSDRRRIALHPSESATSQVRATLMPLLSAIEDIDRNLSPDQSALVLAFLDDLTVAMNDFVRDTDESQPPHRRGPSKP